MKIIIVIFAQNFHKYFLISMKNTFIAFFSLALVSNTLFAQTALERYQSLKVSGTLNSLSDEELYNLNKQVYQENPDRQPAPAVNTTPFRAGNCEYWIPIPPEYRNYVFVDDNPPIRINLPFNFCFYGELHNVLYFNANGLISFADSPNDVPGFTSQALPIESEPAPFGTDYRMICPFWADGDLRGDLAGSRVTYMLGPDYVVITWEKVGYFNSQIDKRNTYQAILTNGSSSILPAGNNVRFNYKDMQWTTGSASGGVNGFVDATEPASTPATVGINKGNGTTFIQVGRFGHSGVDYLTPYPLTNVASGVSWLDNRTFTFDICTDTTNNIPPITADFPSCDTIYLCKGDSTAFNYTFLSPEPNQITTITLDQSQLNGNQILINTNVPGVQAKITGKFVSTVEGVAQFTITATDNGVPAKSNSFTLFIKVGVSNPTVSGTGTNCLADSSTIALDSLSKYSTWTWKPMNVTNTPTIKLPTGSYSVEAISNSGCRKTINFNVSAGRAFIDILGDSTVCAGASKLLRAIPGNYANYNWTFNNQALPNNDSVTANQTGKYKVTVSAANGCESSDSVNFVVFNNPTASYTTNPANYTFVNENMEFVSTSTAGSATITNYIWDLSTANYIDVANVNHTYAGPGTYVTSLKITDANGCTDSTSKTIYVVGTPPNIMTPNGDNLNENFVITNLEKIENTNLTILNRWGEKVYQNSNYKNEFDGSKLTEGTYFYVLSFEQGRVYKGTLTILK